jgi:amino acid permease
MVLLGTIIGAGVFGLPALFSQVGIWPGSMLFGGLVVVVVLTHVFYAEVILHYKKHMRLAGYAERSLGYWAGLVAKLTFPLSMFGALFAYVILGGEFLASIAREFGIADHLLTWQLLFWLGGAITVFFGMKLVAKLEVVGTWALIGTMVVVSVFASTKFHPEALIRAEWSSFFVPYGVFLFAVMGLSVIAEIVELTEYKREIAYPAIIGGTIGAAVLSWLFGVSLALASGPVFGGGVDVLVGLLPAGTGFLIPVVGFLAVATSNITVAQGLKTAFVFDFKLEERMAWLLTFMVPFALLFLTQRNFLNTVGFVGAVFGGIWITNNV